MSSENKTAAEIKSELEDAMNAAKRLRERIESLISQLREAETQLREAETQLRELSGTPGWHTDRGLIGTLKEDLKRAELRERDDSATPVVWERMPVSSSGSRVKIVSRVTAKRIYVRDKGCRTERLFNRDGTPVSSWDGYGKIDVAATLGEGYVIPKKT